MLVLDFFFHQIRDTPTNLSIAVTKNSHSKFPTPLFKIYIAQLQKLTLEKKSLKKEEKAQTFKQF
jgi:hypothetical protein